MKKYILNTKILKSIFAASLLLVLGCQRDITELQQPSYSTNGEVFIDDFSSGLNYAAFGGSDVQAFDVDTQVKYAGTKSMKFAVPDVGSSAGAYAGGSFFTSVGRDLSGYNALTFWIKATQPANINIIGFGNDLGENKYQASISGLAVNTNWKKVYIPIPDPSKLVAERGMFFYSEGPENGKGYTFWVDEVKFEKVPGIAHASASIMNGQNKTVTSFVGVTNQVDGLLSTFSLPNGSQQSVNASPYYFTFKSSNPSVATVSPTGLANTISAGTSTITATLGNVSATGSLIINSKGNFVAAPKPTQPADKVISLFSDVYTNVPVDYFNGYWMGDGQTTLSADFNVNGDHILNYYNLNFVGSEFRNPVVNASSTSHFHIDLYFPDAIPSGANFKVKLVDVGNDGAFGGTGANADTSHTITLTSPTLVSGSWVSLNIPFSSMTGLSSRSHLAQLVFESTTIKSFYADNIYFYNDGSIIPATPTAAAPSPTHAANSVLSIFSDAYTNVPGTDFNPGWGQATVVSQVAIAGNNTLKYAGLNYQGTQFASPLNVSSYGFIHIDYYSANSSSLKFYLISPGPVEKAYTLSVPSGIGTNNNGWKSVDIPLSAFAPVNLGNVIQFKMDGNGDIFFDNIYFHN